MRRVNTLVILLLLFFSYGWSAEGAGAHEQAKRRYAAGEAFFKSGDFRGAIAEFEAADGLSPAPILSYNIALCYERIGDDESAARHYRKYLSRQPSAANRDKVEARIAALEQKLVERRAKPETAAPPAPLPAATPPAVAPPPSPMATPEPPGASTLPTGATGDPPTPAAQAAPPSAGADPLAARIPARSGAAGSARLAPVGTSPYAGPSSPVRQVPPQPAPKSSTPLYKQWGFWLVVGASAFILIDLFDTDDRSRNAAVDAIGRDVTEAHAPLFRY
ncbi:MAG: hypothetical protein HY698_13340 [Deltaproteobacteria bacterium]|nr:hypothetical protein [Deltaproteobacteria bacterium]